MARQAKVFSVITKLAALFLVVCFAFSSFMTTTIAWSSLNQHKTNALTGTYTPDESGEGEFAELTITKTVQNADGSDLTAEQLAALFEFTVTIPCVTADFINVQIDGATSSVPVSSGSFTVQLAHGQSAVVKGLPLGAAYLVSEAAVPGYTTLSANHQGTVLKGGSFVSFINTFGDVPPSDISITIKKVIESNVLIDTDKQFNFTITIDGVQTSFTLKHGEEKTFTLPSGAVYEIIEESDPDYQLSQVTNGSGVAAADAIDAVFTNTFTGTVEIDISGEKTWQLNGSSAAVMPKSIIVYLKAGGTILRSATVTSNESGQWLYSFTMPRYDDDGNEIIYTVEEEPVPGFVSTVDGYNIKNTYKIPETVSVSATKIWAGSGKKEHPQSVTVQLYKNGKPHGDAVALSSKNSWKHTWAGLETGAEWTVDEINVPEGYEKRITGDAATGFVITNYADDVPPETVTISGHKTWLYGESSPASYPEAIIIHVKNGDKIVLQKRITANEHWSWSFTLDKHDGNGNVINYTIDEAPIEGYSKQIDGYNITNTHSTHDQVTISGSKTWNHGGIEERYKPRSITVQVMNGSTMVAQKVVTAADGWNYSFKLPRLDANGNAINYTINEASMPYYSASYNGTSIVNTYKGMDYPGDNPGTESSPKNGDNISLIMWLIVSAVSFAGMAVCLRALSKKKKEQGLYNKF